MTASTKNETFVRLLIEYRQRIFSFIRVLVAGSPLDAEEIFQEVCIVAWKKLDQFDFETDFVRWVNRISYFQVLQHYQKHSRESLVFSSHFLDRIAQEMFCSGEALSRERKTLHACLEKLKEPDRQLIQRRYFEGESAGEIAESSGRPITSICRSLQRIRRRLHSCIRRTIAMEDSMEGWVEG
ncbi:MAG: sigma-70 family RNA polymerase sigma factor [Planctomycetia bacterium]|jgi:RNA polymerase sigma-70 factor (ECF subfamily)